ncbi:helix-turn-helix domain-containing protein [Nocardia sp. NPDC101769]|uniref:helix-turn-helix domain-containing protein n=1 Tax=Nocardia sp. NPDC101769 TaxID=3364333 RepID=UPI00382030B6
MSISERTLRHLLAEGAGLSPKPFAHIARLRSALAYGSAESVHLAQLAATAGYYDQSHMTAEFASMMGVARGVRRRLGHSRVAARVPLSGNVFRRGLAGLARSCARWEGAPPPAACSRVRTRSVRWSIWRSSIARITTKKGST